MSEEWEIYLDNSRLSSPGKLWLTEAFGDLLQVRREIAPYELVDIFAAAPDDGGDNDLAKHLVYMEAELLTHAFLNGFVQTFARPLRGGNIVKIDKTLWELDNFLPRFSTGSFSLSKWHSHESAPTHRILVSDQDFAIWITNLRPEGFLTNDELELVINPLARYKRTVNKHQNVSVNSKDVMQSNDVETLKSTPTERFIYRQEVENMIGMKRSFIYDQMDKNKFPQGIKMGKSTRWLRSEIIAWQNERIAERP